MQPEKHSSFKEKNHPAEVGIEQVSPQQEDESLQSIMASLFQDVDGQFNFDAFSMASAPLCENSHNFIFRFLMISSDGIFKF